MSATGTKVIHRFLRQPNINSNIHNRISNRHDPFANTLIVLKDPKTNRQLYLIGTTNSSTLLAYRTKKLVEELKPSSVYVQASNTWWNSAKLVEVTQQFIIGQKSECLPIGEQLPPLRLVRPSEQSTRHSVETQVLFVDGHHETVDQLPLRLHSLHSRPGDQVRFGIRREKQIQTALRRRRV